MAYRSKPKFADESGLAVDVGHTAWNACGGRAWQKKIRVYGGPTSTPANVLEVVIHELCHVALPARHHHDERFRRVFQRAVREAWGIEAPLTAPARAGCKAYGVGDLVREKLEQLIADGAVTVHAPKPVQKTPRSKLAEALREKRAAHAETMLRRAEKRLKIAKTVQRRWAQKVRYYERVAARKATKEES